MTPPRSSPSSAGRIRPPATPGRCTWDEGPFRQWLARPDLYFYLAGDEGFAAYRWGGDGRHGELFVERVHAATPESLRALWSVIASHSSVARTVTALTAPNDPFWWLTTERDATITKRSMWMLRVVDAPAAIAARGFPPAVAAAVPLEINDSARPANSGSWQLEVADGKGALTPAAPSAARGSIPLSLGARGLAALYAGTPVATLRLRQPGGRRQPRHRRRPERRLRRHPVHGR